MSDHTQSQKDENARYAAEQALPLESAVATPDTGTTLQRFVHQIPGVTGRGTTALPYTGWHQAVAASPAGTLNIFTDGLFVTPVEVVVANPNVSCIGVGITQTKIRCTEARAGNNVIKISRPTDVESRYIKFGDFTLDGADVVECGFYLRDVNFSTMLPIRVINTTTYIGKATRGVGNNWPAIRFHFNDADVTTIPKNGLYLSDIDLIQPDNATTTSEFKLEIAGITGGAVPGTNGIGLDIHNSFGLTIKGGVEACRQNLRMSADCRQIDFTSLDMESGGTASLIEISGHDHKFTAGDWIGSNVSILAGSTGGHVFDRLRCTGTIVDAGSGINKWFDPTVAPAFIARITGANRKNNIQEWEGKTYRQGLMTSSIVSVPSLDAAVPVGACVLEFYVYGSRVGYLVQLPGGGFYCMNTGGVDLTNPATIQANCEANYCWKASTDGVFHTRLAPVVGG